MAICCGRDTKFHGRAFAPDARIILRVVAEPRLFRASLVTALGLVLAGCSSSPEDIGSSQAAVTVCGQTTIKGIDVYHGDNGGAAIDWNAVKSAGIDFAFAKATESTNFHDSMFPTNWSGMKSAGIVRGAYHFFHADVDPVAQAQYFLAYVGTVSAGDLLVLDLETTNNQTQATIAANAASFLSYVQTNSGVTPFLYTSPAFLSDFSALSAYPLWVANYGVSCPNVPAAWTTYTFWQSTGTGSLGPISGALDLDTFNGDLTQLQALGSPPPTDGGTTTTDSSTPTPDSGGTGSEPSDNDASTPPPGSDGGTTNPNWKSNSGCSAHGAGTPERDANMAAFLMLVGLAVSRLRSKR